MKHGNVVMDAAQDILIELANAPEGPQIEQLREKILACVREAETWEDEPPPSERREDLMKTMLDLHVEAAGLGGGSPPR